MTVDIDAYIGFPDDWDKLPPRARRALAWLFARLKEDPYDPRIIADQEMVGDDEFAHELPDGFAVFWKVTAASRFPDISLEDASLKILLKGIRRLES